jgi:hypothetical protein
MIDAHPPAIKTNDRQAPTGKLLNRMTSLIGKARGRL